MNKLTKLGVSALCGSLAAVSSANAGDMTVTGGVDMSWISLEDQTTGNPIGIGSNLTFAGSGEMDNGWTVDLSVAMTNQDAYSNTNVTVGVPGLGDFRISQGVSGSGIDRIDDVTPNVWEEAYAVGVGSGMNTVGGVSGGTNIEWTPTDILPDGLTGRISYSPDVGGSKAADKASAAGAASNPKGSGWDVMLEATDAIHGIAGLTLQAGMSTTEQDSSVANYSGDVDEETFAITYATGGFTVGYQWSEEDLGKSANEKQYENEGYGITFNVNDDLSIGYNHFESDQLSGSTTTVMEATSIQIAYSVGGASVRLADGSVDNSAYQTGTSYDQDGMLLSVSLAF